MPLSELTLPLKDAARALGCSETTLRRIASHGQGLQIRYISNRPLIVKAELDAFLADLPTRPVNKTILSHDLTGAAA
jgi:hypothetical protein